MRDGLCESDGTEVGRLDDDGKEEMEGSDDGFEDGLVDGIAVGSEDG